MKAIPYPKELIEKIKKLIEDTPDWSVVSLTDEVQEWLEDVYLSVEGSILPSPMHPLGLSRDIAFLTHCLKNPNSSTEEKKEHSDKIEKALSDALVITENKMRPENRISMSYRQTN